MSIYSSYLSNSSSSVVLENIIESFNKEFNNFSRICESFEFLTEAGIIMEAEETKKGIIAKIKELWGRFKKWIGDIIKTIKGKFNKKRFDNTKKNAEKLKKDPKAENIIIDKHITMYEINFSMDNLIKDVSWMRFRYLFWKNDQDGIGASYKNGENRDSSVQLEDIEKDNKEYIDTLTNMIVSDEEFKSGNFKNKIIIDDNSTENNIAKFSNLYIINYDNLEKTYDKLCNCLDSSDKRIREYERHIDKIPEIFDSNDLIANAFAKIRQDISDMKDYYGSMLGLSKTVFSAMMKNADVLDRLKIKYEKESNNEESDED